MDIMQALQERYSYRGRYLPDAVPREDLRKIMEMGLAAPSGCNTQTTSLIALDDPAVVAEIGGMLGKPHFASAPAAICVLTRHIPAYDDKYFNVQDYSAAIENMLLAITALGYASCWVEGHITGDDHRGRSMARALGVPDEYTLVAYLPVGKPGGECPRAGKKPFAERAWFNGYKK